MRDLKRLRPTFPSFSLCHFADIRFGDSCVSRRKGTILGNLKLTPCIKQTKIRTETHHWAVPIWDLVARPSKIKIAIYIYMPYLSSTQLPETLVFLLLPGKSPFGAIKNAMDEVLNRGKTAKNLKHRLTPTPPWLRGIRWIRKLSGFGETII